MYTIFLSETLKKRDNFGDLRVHGSIITNTSFRHRVYRYGLDLKMVQVVIHWWASGSIKAGNLLTTYGPM
jgi:hypothetical protein